MSREPDHYNQGAEFGAFKARPACGGVAGGLTSAGASLTRCGQCRSFSAAGARAAGSAAKLPCTPGQDTGAEDHFRSPETFCLSLLELEELRHSSPYDWANWAETKSAELPRRGQGPAMEYRGFFDQAVSQLKAERRYRVFADLERDASAYPSAKWHRGEGAGDVTIWCSNDYLGMGRHPAVIAALRDMAEQGRRRRRRHAQYLGHQPCGCRTRGRTCRSARQRGRARLHLGLDFQSRFDLDDRRPFAELPDPLRRAQSQFDDRGD